MEMGVGEYLFLQNFTNLTATFYGAFNGCQVLKLFAIKKIELELKPWALTLDPKHLNAGLEWDWFWDWNTHNAALASSQMYNYC